MDMRRLQAEFSFPQDHAGHWSTRIEVPASSVDDLGHVTAAHYSYLYEEAGLRFVSRAWDQQWPSYVTAQAHLHYRREIVLDRTPVTVHVAVTDLTSSSFDLAMTLVDATGTACGAAFNHYVAWDRDGRHRRELTDAEAAGLRTHGGDAS